MSTSKRPRYGGEIPLTALKIVDSAINTVNITQTPTATDINITPQKGTNYFNRLGERTVGQALRVKGGIVASYTSGTTPPNTVIRLMLVYDRQTNGSLANASDVITTITHGGAQTQTVYSHPNMGEIGRFQILWDELFGGGSQGASGVPSATTGGVVTTQDDMIIDRVIQLHDLQTSYKGTRNSGTLSDVATGGIFLIAAQDSSPVAWKFNFSIRYEFTD